MKKIVGLINKIDGFNEFLIEENKLAKSSNSISKNLNSASTLNKIIISSCESILKKTSSINSENWLHICSQLFDNQKSKNGDQANESNIETLKQKFKSMSPINQCFYVILIYFWCIYSNQTNSNQNNLNQKNVKKQNKKNEQKQNYNKSILWNQLIRVANSPLSLKTQISFLLHIFSCHNVSTINTNTTFQQNNSLFSIDLFKKDLFKKEKQKMRKIINCEKVKEFKEKEFQDLKRDYQIVKEETRALNAKSAQFGKHWVHSFQFENVEQLFTVLIKETEFLLLLQIQPCSIFAAKKNSVSKICFDLCKTLISILHEYLFISHFITNEQENEESESDDFEYQFKTAKEKTRELEKQEQMKLKKHDELVRFLLQDVWIHKWNQAALCFPNLEYFNLNNNITKKKKFKFFDFKKKSCQEFYSKLVDMAAFTHLDLLLSLLQTKRALKIVWTFISHFFS